MTSIKRLRAAHHDSYRRAAFGSLIAATLLTGCGDVEPAATGEDTNRQAAADQTAEANTVPGADTSYRCADGSVVFVTTTPAGGVSASRHPGDTPVRLAATTQGAPATGPDGWSITLGQGEATIAVPGKPAQRCEDRATTLLPELRGDDAGSTQAARSVAKEG